MRSLIKPKVFSADIRVPSSKSHTIRRLLFAALAEGESLIERPLDSLDTRSCLAACRAFGAAIKESGRGEKLVWTIGGLGLGDGGGVYRELPTPESIIDVGNSGTTLFLAIALAALGQGWTFFTGDTQIRRRSAEKLLAALRELGAEAISARMDGCSPLAVRGPYRGGETLIECPTSQYLSALLIASPLAPSGAHTRITVPLLNERPYVGMTLEYLHRQGVAYHAASDWSVFDIPGGYRYKPLSGPVPGDFSSAAFPACAAAITGGPVSLRGLDPEDTQGDKALFGCLESFGCTVSWSGLQGDKLVRIQRERQLSGQVFDLNAIPDALPILAAVACYAKGTTRLINVPNARIKETDRIAVMARELRKLGADIIELDDGLELHGGGGLMAGAVDSHGDHRVAMALATAALGADGPVLIEGAECAAVTYPGYLDAIGAVSA